ncbi:17-beta-hydroxysteroid dehydrogenase type 6-like [Haliotis rufescens]|uniref:17-beta-hydroxysteroid dehydrogenase type 6-like n=1 Tax=Haliotis rufescens TaxID=6454 RepID=UPI00201F26F0|nr:17-beta-hydroxysteroid dehydrogenase type 6-like [Haliotis rufescens]XP_046363974.2 17-beta-hydroxysteroid dehydrogenase type 6-like [Haliotis rufescens]XP_046363975.2 17-beta-hydroxysteroid dehydrogenase type 6-like [Haliotis rufescens]XP_048237282.1 17-beta-hydroxysteroid dehydrogenase type 6-like [Haliotis rufescens]
MLEEAAIYQVGLLISVLSSGYAALQPCVLLAVLCLAIGYICFTALQRKRVRSLSAYGRTVLITGCDTGIGYGLAQRLLLEGFTVIATCLDVEGPGARELKKNRSGRVHVIRLDVTSDESVELCFERARKICKGTGLWGLVNNAGVVSFGDVELTTMDIFQRVVDVNLLGVIRVTKAFLPLVRYTQGRIVNVTSVKGLCAYPCFGAYNISKYGAEGLTDTLRLEMKRFGVKVIAVEPGNFGGATALWDESNTERLRREMADMTSGATDEALTTYGDDYLDQMLSMFKEGTTYSRSNIDPLLDDFVDALTNQRPAYRYATHGGSTLLDIDVLLTVWKNYLPTSLLDYLVMKYRGIPARRKAGR